MLFSVRAVTPAAVPDLAAGEVRRRAHAAARAAIRRTNTPPPYTHVTPSNALAAPSSKKGSL